MIPTTRRGFLKSSAAAGMTAAMLGGYVAYAAEQVSPPPTLRPPTAPPTAPVVDQHGPTIKETYAKCFLLGMAGDVPGNYSDTEVGLIRENFGVVTPENCMKPAPVHPAEDTWRFERPDALVTWCRDKNLIVHGHTLVWHAQTNPWFFEGGDKAVDTRRLRDHITTLVGRYKGKIRSWDVVNEALNDRGDTETAKTENLRNSRWLQTLGPEFLALAFQYAHEADPDAELYYNDYGIEAGPKHASSMLLLQRLIKDGAPIHGVGIQGHWSTATVPFDAIDRAITDYKSLGLKVSISELDVTIRGASGGQIGGRGGFGGRRGPVTPASPQDLQAQAAAYARLFSIFANHEDAVERVTFWGLSDRRTWRFGQHPLIFDADNRRKPAYVAIVDALRKPKPEAAEPR
jgi:GH35 family endo-1,4-beta-xylanase